MTATGQTDVIGPPTYTHVDMARAFAEGRVAFNDAPNPYVGAGLTPSTHSPGWPCGGRIVCPMCAAK